MGSPGRRVTTLPARVFLKADQLAILSQWKIVF